MRGGSAPWAVAALAALLAGCGRAPVPSPLPDPSPVPAPAQLRSFRFPWSLNPSLAADCEASIDGAAVTAGVPLCADRGSLVAQFEAQAVSVLVGGAVQVSGASANDFRGPLVYTLAGEDGERREYVVRVTGTWADDFDRQDSAQAGGEWIEIEPATGDGTEVSIADGALVLRGSSEPQGRWPGVQRDFPGGVQGPVRASLRFTRAGGSLLSVEASGQSPSDCWKLALLYNDLCLYRGGVYPVAARTVSVDGSHPHVLAASVEGPTLTATLTDTVTGVVQSLAWTDPSPPAGLARIVIRGGEFFASTCLATTIDRVDLAAGCGSE